MILSLLLSTFITVFVAELGDKTQLATLTISGTSNRPLAVFLGSASALVFASLLGAFAGTNFKVNCRNNFFNYWS